MQAASLFAQVLLGDSPERKLRCHFSGIPYLPLVLQQQNYFSLTINAVDVVSIKGKEALVTDKSKVSITPKINIRKSPVSILKVTLLLHKHMSMAGLIECFNNYWLHIFCSSGNLNNYNHHTLIQEK